VFYSNGRPSLYLYVGDHRLSEPLHFTCARRVMPVELTSSNPLLSLQFSSSRRPSRSKNLDLTPLLPRLAKSFGLKTRSRRMLSSLHSRCVKDKGRRPPNCKLGYVFRKGIFRPTVEGDFFYNGFRGGADTIDARAPLCSEAPVQPRLLIPVRLWGTLSGDSPLDASSHISEQESAFTLRKVRASTSAHPGIASTPAAGRVIPTSPGR
jgi:hypothetical protein